MDLGGGLTVKMPRTQINEVLTPPEQDHEQYEVTLDPTDLWRYKTPSLRNVALTAPYMHNGALLTLEEVVDYYDHGGTGSEGQDPKISPLTLTQEEKHALVAFLRSLQAIISKYSRQKRPRLCSLRNQEQNVWLTALGRPLPYCLTFFLRSKRTNARCESSPHQFRYRARQTRTSGISHLSHSMASRHLINDADRLFVK